ncbi:hypothetical protein KUCAC02_029719 [Chaenocephalus aceratus]|nr:hypothetical protein KUCAC02_029719 [Chaenocephalus aceratus]
MQPITLPPSIEAVMTEYRDYNAGIDPDTKLSGDVQSKVKVYQDPSNRYYASNPGVKEALSIRQMFTDSIAQATTDAQAEAGIEAEAAGPSAPPAPEPKAKRKRKRKRKTSCTPPAPEPEPEPEPAPAPERKQKRKRKRKTSSAPTQPKAGRAPVHCPEVSDNEFTLVYHYTSSEDESDVKFQAGSLERANKREKERHEETLLDSADDDNPLESTCLSKTLEKQSL